MLSYCVYYVCTIGVKWLDFFENLMEPATKISEMQHSNLPLKLKDVYNLDGTHMSPVYLHLLEESLNGL